MRTDNTARRTGRRYAAAPLAEINIIPLVDVTLVVLIIFLVTTTFDKTKKIPPQQTPTPELSVTLPFSAAATAATNVAPPLVLGIDKMGRKYIGTEPVSTEALQSYIRSVAAKGSDTHIRIDADRDTRYEDVVEVIELCQFEGLHNVGLHCSNTNH